MTVGTRVATPPLVNWSSLRRYRATPLRLLLLAALLAWPWVPGLPVAYVNDASTAFEYALVAVSLVLLTGWVGQISLAQGAFVGVAGFTTSLVFNHLGIRFPFSLPAAVAASAAVAVMLGVVALRVRGLYLAVATLIFGWMADRFLFAASWFVGIGGSAQVQTPLIGMPGTLTVFDLYDGRVFYWVALAALGLGILLASNLRDSKSGRAFAAVKGSEVAAASLGIDVTRYKLLAFAISGGLAGLAGNLQITGQGSAVPDEYNFLSSLFFLSVAVVGGLTSLRGAIAAGLLFAALNEVFFRVTSLNGYIDIVSAMLLLVVLLAYPGGLAAAGARVQGLSRSLLRRRQEPGGELPTPREAAAGLAVTPGHQVAAPPPIATDRATAEAILEAEEITIRFGGLTAVDSVSLRVNRGEIVGLIGPNGAGKTTLFNAVAGLNQPAAGRVKLYGRDVTNLPVHERAALGVGRTFQLIQLFPEQTVFENLLTATHLANRTGFLQHALLTTRALHTEADVRDRVHEVVAELGMEALLQRRVAGLPFGVLRTVELARALVTGAKFVMLDEPASGLDNAETENLAQRLLRLRADLGLTILLIEHDVPMVTSVSDYIYVINRGRLLAEGTAEAVQRNEDVVLAYLGVPTSAMGVPA